MTLKEGTLLQGGKYKIKRFISNGGFGVTYEGEHTLLHKRLAIKEFFVKDFCNRDEQTLHVTVGTKSKTQLVEKLKRKFIDEAAAISSLKHPNIVDVSDVFEENGTAYYIMDFIDGHSLQDLVKHRGALPEREAVDYVLQVASALELVHSNNRLHLDVKPGNIMVDKRGRAILIDFGASKQYDEVEGENTSTLMGKTPGYAPLEQMGNRVQLFYPATDVYSLGATLYKLLTGITPPDAANMAVDETLLKPLPETISDPVRRAVRQSFERLVKDRPQSMKEFAQMLTEQYQDEPSADDSFAHNAANRRANEQQTNKVNYSRPQPVSPVSSEDEETIFETDRRPPRTAQHNKPSAAQPSRVLPPRPIPEEPLEPLDEDERPAKRPNWLLINTIIIVLIVLLAGALYLVFADGNSSSKGSGEDTTLVKQENDTAWVNHEPYYAYTEKNGIKVDSTLEGYYTGTKVNGEVHGMGEFEFLDGTKFKGDFKDGEMEKGVFTNLKGERFFGEVRDNGPYNGEWRDSKGRKICKIVNGKESYK